MRAEQVTDPITYHGEGPVWSDSWGGLRWALIGRLLGRAFTLRRDTEQPARRLRDDERDDS